MERLVTRLWIRKSASDEGMARGRRSAVVPPEHLSSVQLEQIERDYGLERENKTG
jgi:hypothetical protein